MSKEKFIVPSTEEIKKLLSVATNDAAMADKTIGALLGMKLVDSFLPKVKGEPDWDYKGLKQFFHENGIETSDTFAEAMNKLK